MCPARITVTVKLEDSDLPAESVTVQVPHNGVARHLLTIAKDTIGKHYWVKEREAKGEDNLAVDLVTHFGTRLGIMRPKDEAKTLEAKADAKRINENYRGAVDALENILTMVDIALSRAQMGVTTVLPQKDEGKPTE
jgi:hypothetical protein